jgi:hypothetical protein
MANVLFALIASSPPTPSSRVQYERNRFLLALVIAFLAGTAGVLIATDSLPSTQRDRRSEEFQRLVGGMGLGPAVDLSRCGFSFDPRLCPECPLNHEPVPGGVYFCPQHACSILYYPRLVPSRSSAR